MHDDIVVPAIRSFNYWSLDELWVIIPRQGEGLEGAVGSSG